MYSLKKTHIFPDDIHCEAIRKMAQEEGKAQYQSKPNNFEHDTIGRENLTFRFLTNGKKSSREIARYVHSGKYIFSKTNTFVLSVIIALTKIDQNGKPCNCVVVYKKIRQFLSVTIDLYSSLLEIRQLSKFSKYWKNTQQTLWHHVLFLDSYMDIINIEFFFAPEHTLREFLFIIFFTLL